MKKIIFIILLAIVGLSENLIAQCSSWEWINTSTNGSYDEVKAMCTDAIGNVYITGEFTGPSISFGIFNLTNSLLSNDKEIFVVKYDASGTVLWATSAGGSGADYVTSIAADNNGYTYITGYFSEPTATFGSNTFNSTIANQHTLYLSKLDAVSGSFVWTKYIYGNEANAANAICIINNGIYIIGSFSSENLFFSGYSANGLANSSLDPTYDIFVAEYDNSGNLVWNKSYGGDSGDDKGNAITTDGTNLYITGSYNSSSISFGPSGTVQLTNSGGSNSFFTKLSATNGLGIWANQPTDNSASTEIGKAVVTDATGNVYFAGEFAGGSINIGGANTLTNSGDYDIFIFKYDATGAFQIARRAGGSGNDQAFCLSKDISGYIYLTGGYNATAFSNFTFPGSGAQLPIITTSYTYSFSATLGNSADFAFITKFNANLNPVCQAPFPSGGDDVFAICNDLFGNIYISGDYRSNQFNNYYSGISVLLNGITEKAFTAKYSCITSLNLNASDASICNGQSVTINANVVPSTAGIYTWSFGNQSFSTSNSSITDTPANTTVYTCTFNANSGCSATQTFTVTVNPNPTFSILATNSTPTPLIVCQGGSTNLTANGMS